MLLHEYVKNHWSCYQCCTFPAVSHVIHRAPQQLSRRAVMSQMQGYACVAQARCVNFWGCYECAWKFASKPIRLNHRTKQISEIQGFELKDARTCGGVALSAVLGILHAHVDSHASVTKLFLSNWTKRGGEFPTWGRERGKPSLFRERVYRIVSEGSKRLWPRGSAD